MHMQVPQVLEHLLIKAVLLRLHNMDEVDKCATSHFWLLKALAQLTDLYIYHPEDATAAKARDALLPGETASDVHLLDTLYCIMPVLPNCTTGTQSAQDVELRL